MEVIKMKKLTKKQIMLIVSGVTLMGLTYEARFYENVLGIQCVGDIYIKLYGKTILTITPENKLHDSLATILLNR